MQGMPAFPAYNGDPSMFQVHKFMNLNAYQLGYFVEQVALAGASFGVAQADLEGVGAALQHIFGLRCAPPAAVVQSQGPQLQAICINMDSCPLAPDAVCGLYDGMQGNGTAVSSSSSSGTATPTVAPSKTAATSTTAATAGAAAVGLSIGAAVAGFAALLV